jgi:hypothetical protein
MVLGNTKTRTEKDSRVFDGSGRDPDTRVRFPLALPEISLSCTGFSSILAAVTASILTAV